MNKRIRLKDGFLLVPVLLVLGAGGCGKARQPDKKSESGARVVIATAGMSRMEEILQTTGEVLAMNTVTLMTTAEGPIAFCPWREGDMIDQAGQALITIDRPVYRQELAVAEAALAQAQARFDDLKAGARPEEIAQMRESVRQFADCTAFAEADLERVRALVGSGTLPAEDEEKARVEHVKCHTQLVATKAKLAMLEAGPTATELEVARATVGESAARLAMAKAKLAECTIPAPFAGVVTEVNVRPGDMAVPRQPLLKMIDPASLVVCGGLPEAAAVALRKGAEATVTLDAYPGQTFKAVVERIHPRLESGSRTRLVEFRLTDSIALLPRMFARVLMTGRVAEEAVAVPVKAVVATPRGDNVAFVVEQGKAVRRIVTLGIEQGDRVQITSGIQTGETVVVNGNLNLKHGALVTPVSLSSESGKGTSL